MIDRPSACYTHEELCDEFDWLFEFQSRMAEHIKDDPDVHNMVDYVNKLEHENARLRELARHLYACLSFCDRKDEERGCGFCPYRSASESCEFELRLLELGIEVCQ